MGKYFADQGFPGVHLKSLEASRLVELENDRLTIDGESFNCEEVARSCGLLTFAPATTLYYIPTLPLTQFLIGKYLAEDARRNPHAPVGLIETFQRWIWRPYLHDILDYTFDALWHSERQEVSRWGNELLTWANGAGKQDATRPNHTAEPTQDDLMHPFAVAAARWRLLAPETRPADLGSEVKEVIQAIMPSLEIGVRVTDLINELLSDDQLCFHLIEALIAEHVKAKYDPDLTKHPRWAIGNAAAGVSEGSAAMVVSRLIAECGKHHDDFLVQATLRGAIWNAAGRVSEAKAAEVVSQWIAEHAKAKNDPEAQSSWRFAIRRALDQVSEAAAAEVVSRLITEYGKAKDDPRAQADWRESIEAAVGRVSKEAAPDFVSQWIAEHGKPLNESEGQGVGRLKIQGSEACVSEAAAQLVPQLIMEHGKAEDDPLVQATLRGEIWEVAGEVSEAAAATVMSQWIAEHEKAKDDQSAQGVWRLAIERVAGRVNEGTATNLTSQLISEHRKAKDDPYAQEEWRRAIALAAGRVNEGEATDLMSQLIAEHGKAKGDPDGQQAWRSAIRGAATRVRDDSAVKGESSTIPVCDLLVANDMEQIAFRIVANNPSLAMVSVSVTESLRHWRSGTDIRHLHSRTPKGSESSIRIL